MRLPNTAPAVAIPARAEEITEDWLAVALGCPREHIRNVRVRPPDEASGLYSQIYFVEIDSAPEAGLPPRVVAKAMSLFDATAAGMREWEVFARESFFYADLAPQLPIRTPRAFFAANDTGSGTGILLLEDCSSMEARDHKLPNPTSERELLLAVDVSARLCVASWDAQWLDHPLLLQPGNSVWESYFAAMQEGWCALASHPLMRYSAPGFADVARRLGESFHQLLNLAWPKERRSVLHFDYHCGNWFYDGSRPDDPIVVFDWQAVGAGRSIFDVAYLLGGMYPPELRRRLERVVIERFVQGVHAGGVLDYSTDEAWADYELGMLMAQRLPPLFVNDLDTSTAVGAALAEKTVRNLSMAAMDLGGHAWLDSLEERARA